MHLKQINQRPQKYKINKGEVVDNKCKKQKTNKESNEFKKIYILSPTINISNKECFIFEPLKTDLASATQKRNFKIINNTKDNNNKFKDEDLLKLEKIKVRLNSIKQLHNKIIDTGKKNINRIGIGDSNDKTVNFNYSCLNNIMRKSKNNNKSKNNKNKSELFNTIQNSFDSSKYKALQKNKNLSFGNYFNQICENNFLSLNRNYTNKTNNNNNMNKYNEIKKEKYNKYTTKNNMRYNDIKNLKFNNVRNASPLNTGRYKNKSYITKRNNIQNSNSFKSITKETLENSKKIKNNERNNNINEESLFSPKCNYLYNTYQRKLIKNHFIKQENNNFDNKIFKFDNSISTNRSKNDNDNAIDINNIYHNQNNIINTPKKYIPNNNNLNILGVLNAKIKHKNKNNNNLIIIKKNKIQSTIYNKNKNLYNGSNYNKEKGDSKTELEENLISNYNYSTSNSFYHNQKNNSNTASNKNLLSSIKLGHKLKNIITSIIYNNNNNNNSQMEQKNKNVLLLEYNKDGKLNCKIREMKNSVEKIIGGNSKSKYRNKTNEASPKNQRKGIISLYIKKNQGTILRKTKNKIELYN